MHADLDALDNFLDTKDDLDTYPPSGDNGSSSVVIPMDDMELILTQMWKSRHTEPKMGELYEKYKKLTT